MYNSLKSNEKTLANLRADCENCFGLCCVALPYAKSADFPFNKDSGTPCRNLQTDYRCSIHQDLRKNGFRGCTSYDCFGAGQKVSRVTFKGNDWRDNPESAKTMFDILPIMQQLHEMLYYLYEALQLDDAKPIHPQLEAVFEETEKLTMLGPEAIFALDIPVHRVIVNELLLQTSKLVRSKVSVNKGWNRGRDLIGAKLRGAELRGANLRGALVIAADLRQADMRNADLIGADFRDADLSGADLTGSIFLTQAQVNSARGDKYTKLPPALRVPNHWLIEV
ncbi:pentapeptide repeat-containing protein [Bacillus sp. NEB1478]|uniref:pentapeptide repeat-containing protein n=1 Tax=Bacillus sp. NEB1478 TaxID=3073816 RepID=UPI002873CE9C|nr:pentapeptide repeat-containing protein [Bacillus sp. NEB1478]WNB91022.1 pentapeptide repeat-containing protein [Bacillus sp. NEB1478]